MPVQDLYESVLRSQMFDAPFQSFGGNSDPVKFIYGHKANFKWSDKGIVGYLETMAVRLYRSCTNRD